jgi:hypothetical protein
MQVLLFDKSEVEIFNIPDAQLQAIRQSMYGDQSKVAHRRSVLQLLLADLHKLWPDFSVRAGHPLKYVCFFNIQQFSFQ